MFIQLFWLCFMAILVFLGLKRYLWHLWRPEQKQGESQKILSLSFSGTPSFQKNKGCRTELPLKGNLQGRASLCFLNTSTSQTCLLRGTMCFPSQLTGVAEDMQSKAIAWHWLKNNSFYWNIVITGTLSGNVTIENLPVKVTSSIKVASSTVGMVI